MKVSGNQDKRPFFFVLKQLIARYMYHPKKRKNERISQCNNKQTVAMYSTILKKLNSRNVYDQWVC